MPRKTGSIVALRAARSGTSPAYPEARVDAASFLDEREDLPCEPPAQGERRRPRDWQQLATARLDVVVADAHQLVRAGFCALVSDMHGMRVVADAADVTELLAVLESIKPDVVMADLALHGRKRESAIEEVRERFPSLPVLGLWNDDSRSTVRRAMAAGARGYLAKTATAHELEIALRNVAASGVHLSAHAIRQLLAESPPEDHDDTLTPRQRQIVAMFAQGKSAKQIAFDLGLSPRTVDVHRARIFHRLGVSTLASLTLYAVRQGLVEP